MVRETRYLLVRNIPEKSTEESINHYFQRYGKIQSVKIQPPAKDSETTITATVAFMDIRSASKAHNSKNTVDSNVLRTEYWDALSSTVRTQGDSARSSSSIPGASGTYGSGAPASTVSRSAGSNGSSGAHGSWTTGSGSFQRHGGEGARAQTDVVDRSRSPDHSTTGSMRNKKSVSVSRSASRSRSRSPRSRSGSSSSRTAYSTESSSKSCSKSQSHGSSQASARVQSTVLRSTVASVSEIKDLKSADKQKESDSEDRRPLGICITGLPARSSDSSLRDGLFHEYKKHGKVTTVQIVNEGDNRHAVVSFRKPEDASKALEASQGKMFFGTKIKVTSHEGIKVEDADIRTNENDLDEFHPKSTRTLFVGNLEKDTTVQDLIGKFSPFGDVIDVDIKRQGAASAYAFVQYTDISSVVQALREMEGEHIGANKIKLGFGKSMPTNCVWIDGCGENLTEKSIYRVFKKYGEVTYTFVDRKKWRALVFFTNLDDAQFAVNEMKGRPLGKRRIMIDFASRECQSNFLDRMEKTGQMRPENRPDERGLHKFRQRSFEYQEGFPEENRARFAATGSQPAGAPSSFYRGRVGRGRNRHADGSFQEDFSPSRRNSRQSSEFSQAGFYKSIDDYEQELRDYGHSQRERRERGHSPRRDDYDDRSRRSSREVSLDCYDSKDVYTRSSTPSSEHNSFRSERFVTRTVEEKFRTKSDDKVIERLSDGSDFRGRRSPVYVSGRSTPDGDEMGSGSPPTPTEAEEPFSRTFYTRNIDANSDFKPTYTVIEAKPKLKSVWVPPGNNSTSMPPKLGSEVTLPEKSSVRKRLHEDSVSNKDSTSKKKGDRLESVGSLTLKMTPAERERQRKQQKRAFGKSGSKVTKGDAKTRVKLEAGLESPCSSGSHPESENGSVSETELQNLQLQKQKLLVELGKEDGDLGADHHLDTEHTDLIPSSKKNCHKQMEEITKMEFKLKEKQKQRLALQAVKGRTGGLDLDFKVSVAPDSGLLDGSEGSPLESKRRKIDFEDASDVLKHSYQKDSSEVGDNVKLPSKGGRTVVDVSGGVASSRKQSLVSDRSGHPQSKDVAAKSHSGTNSGVAQKVSGAGSLRKMNSAGQEKAAKGVPKPFLPSSSAVLEKTSTWSPKFGPSPEACFSPAVSEEAQELESNNSESLKSSPKPLSPLGDWPAPTSTLSPAISDDEGSRLDLKSSEPGLSSLAHVDDSLSDSSVEEGTNPGELSLEDRIRMVDEIMNMPPMNKTPDVSALSASTPGTGGTSLLSTSNNLASSLYSKFRIRKRVDAPLPGQGGLASDRKNEPSEIMQTLLNRRSILDQDYKRLGQQSDKFETPVTVGQYGVRPSLHIKPSAYAAGLPGRPLPAVDNGSVPVVSLPAVLPVTTASASMQLPTATTTTTMAGQPITTVTTSTFYPGYRSPFPASGGLAVPTSSPTPSAASPRGQQPALLATPLASLPGSRSPRPSVSPSPQLQTAEPPVLEAAGLAVGQDRSRTPVSTSAVSTDQDSAWLATSSAGGLKTQVHSALPVSGGSGPSSVQPLGSRLDLLPVTAHAPGDVPSLSNGSRSPRGVLSVNVNSSSITPVVSALSPAARKDIAVSPAATRKDSAASPAAKRDTSVSPAARKDTSMSPAARKDITVLPVAKKDTSMSPAAKKDTTASPAARKDTSLPPATKKDTSTAPADLDVPSVALGSSPSVEAMQTSESVSVAEVTPTVVDQPQKDIPSTPSKKVERDSSGRHNEEAVLTKDLENNTSKATVTTSSSAISSAASVMHSTPASTSSVTSSSLTSSSVTTTSSSTTSSAGKSHSDRPNKPKTTHSRSIDQSVKHDPLFAPDIKPEPPKPDTKPSSSKDKDKVKAGNPGDKHDTAIKSENEAKEKKLHSKSAQAEKKLPKSLSKDSSLERSEKKDTDKQDQGSSQKSSDRSRHESGTRTKNKDKDEHHSKGKEAADSSSRSKEKDLAAKHKEPSDLSSSKDVDSSSKGKDVEAPTKARENDAHPKSKERKADAHKTKEKDGDSHGKVDPKDGDAHVKAKDGDSHGKAKDKEHHSQSKSSEKEVEPPAKAKEKVPDSHGKVRESSSHGKSKDNADNHNKSRSKHKDEKEEKAKKEPRDQSTDSDARSKSKDRSNPDAPDSRSKSKEKHHDSHKKEKKVATEKKEEKKVPEKVEPPKEEKEKAPKEEKEKAPKEEKEKAPKEEKEKAPKEDKKGHSKAETKKEEKKTADSHDKTKERSKLKDKQDKHEVKAEAAKPDPKPEKTKADHQDTPPEKKKFTIPKVSDSLAEVKEHKSHAKESQKPVEAPAKSSSSKSSKDVRESNNKANKNKEVENAKTPKKSKSNENEKAKEKQKKEEEEKKKEEEKRREEEKKKEEEKRREEERRKEEEKRKEAERKKEEEKRREEEKKQEEERKKEEEKKKEEQRKKEEKREKEKLRREKEREKQRKEREKQKQREKEKEKEKLQKEKEKQKQKAKEKKAKREKESKEKLREKEVEMESSSSQKDDNDDFPYHLIEEPVYTSMYDTIKRRSCTKTTPVNEVSSDTRKKLDKLQSRRGSSKKSKSRGMMDDTSDDSDQNLLSSLESDSEKSDSDSQFSVKKKAVKKKPPQQATKKKRALISSSSDDEEEEVDEAALLRAANKSKQKSAQEKKNFKQIFDSSSSDSEEMTRDSSLEPLPKPKMPPKQQEKNNKPKKQPKKRKSTDESNDLDIPELQPVTKAEKKGSSYLATVSELSMSDDGDGEKMDVEPPKKAKKKKKTEEKQAKQKPSADDAPPAKKQKLSASKENLLDVKEKKEKKEKLVERKPTAKDEKKMPVLADEKLESAAEMEKGKDQEKEKPPELSSKDVKKKKDSSSKAKKAKKEQKEQPAEETPVLEPPAPAEPKKKESEDLGEKKKKKKKTKKEEADGSQPSPQKEPVASKPEMPTKVSEAVAQEPEEPAKPKAAAPKTEEKANKAAKPDQKEKKKRQKKVDAEGRPPKPSESMDKAEKTAEPKKTSSSTVKDGDSQSSAAPAAPAPAPEAKKETGAKQEKEKEKREKKSKAKAAQEKTEKSQEGSTLPAKDGHSRDPILQTLADDMEKLKDKTQKKEKPKEDSKDNLSDDPSKPKPKKKKKKKEVPEKSPQSFAISSLVAETALKQPEPEPPAPAANDATEDLDPFVSFWGHPAPLIHKKRDSIPRPDDGKEKDDKDKKPDKTPEAASSPEKTPTSTVITVEDETSETVSAKPDAKPEGKGTADEKGKSTWANLFDAPLTIDQDAKPLISIPEEAFKPIMEDISEKSDTEATKPKKKKAKKEKKDQRKGAKEIDPLAAVEMCLEATKTTTKDDPTVLLQDVIDKKAVFPERRFSYEDNISIPKESSPLFEARGLLSPARKVDKSSPKQQDSKEFADLSQPEGEEMGLFTPFTKPERVDKVPFSGAEQVASSVADTEEQKPQEGDGLVHIERNERDEQAASDEAARAVQALMGGLEEDNNQFGFDTNENLQMAAIHPETTGVLDPAATPTSPSTALMDPIALQGQPETAGPIIPEASEAPQSSAQPDVQEQSLSVMEQLQQPDKPQPQVEAAPDTVKKGQRRGKKQRSKGSKDTPQKEDPVLQPSEEASSPLKGFFPGQSPPGFSETHLPEVSKVDDLDSKKNRMDAYDFDKFEDDDPGMELIVESAHNSIQASSADEGPQTVKSPRRKNASSRGRGRRGRGGSIRDTPEKTGKVDQPPQSPVVDPLPTVPVTTVSQMPVIPPWQQGIVKDDLASPESKTDLDSSYGEAELVINLEDQGTPTDGEERTKAQYQFGSDTEDKSPAHPASMAASPYKTQRPSRTRKPTNYKAMDQGLNMNISSPRTSRSGSSPRGSRGGQSPKNPSTPRSRGSPKASSEMGSPVVKLEKLEVSRGKRKDDTPQKGRGAGGKESEGIDITHRSFEDWKASNMLSTVDTKPISKDNIYEFEASELEQKLEPSPTLRGARGRNKRPSESSDTSAPGKPMEMTSPLGALHPTHPMQATVQQQPAGPMASLKELGPEEQASDDSTSSMSNVDKMIKVSSMSNVDRIIDAVSKGIFDGSDQQPEEEKTQRSTSRGRNAKQTPAAGKVDSKSEVMAAAMSSIPGKAMAEFPMPGAEDQAVAGAPLHHKGKGKHEMMPKLPMPGDLSGFPQSFPHGFSMPSDVAAMGQLGGQLGKTAPVLKQEPPPATTVAWQSVVSTSTSNAHSKLQATHPDLPPQGIPTSSQPPGFADATQAYAVAASSSQSPGLPPPPPSGLDVISRGKKGEVPSSEAHQGPLGPPPPHGMMGMRGGLGREETSPLAQMSSMFPPGHPASMLDQGRRTGVFAIPSSRDQGIPPQGLVSGLPVSRGGSHEPRYTSPKMSATPVNVITTGPNQLSATNASMSNPPGLSKHPLHGMTSPTSMPPVPALVQAPPHPQVSPKLSHGVPKGWSGAPGSLPSQQTPIHTPPPPSPSQVSPTSAMQPQRPQSVQLPVVTPMDPNPAPLALKRPPSAHSNQPTSQASGRDRPGRPPSHHSDLRPPSLPGNLLPPQELGGKGAGGQERRERELEREREQQIRQNHLVSLQCQSLAPPGFYMVQGEHVPMAIPHSMVPPHSQQHDPAKLVSAGPALPGVSSAPVSVTIAAPTSSHHSGRRGSLQDSVPSKVPPATSASALYSGVVAGQPRSLSPKTASPVGQVIERLPNPMRPMEGIHGARGAGHAHRPTAPPGHQDAALLARYKDEPMRALHPPAAHGEHQHHLDYLMHQTILQDRQRMQTFILAREQAVRNAVARNHRQELAHSSAIAQDMAARSTVAAQEASRKSAQEAARNAEKEASAAQVRAAQETANKVKEAARQEAAFQEVLAAHNAVVERSIQEGLAAGRSSQESGLKAGPLPPTLGKIMGIPSSTASVQQVPLNLADSDSRSGSSDRGSAGKPPFTLPPGPMERERGGKGADRPPPDAPHLPSSAFVPPPGSAPLGTHREGLPVYGGDLGFAPFVVPRMLDPRLYAGQQHHPQFLPGREGVLPAPFQQFVPGAGGQRFPLDQHTEAERLLKKVEIPPGGLMPMGRSPSPIPSPSPRLPPEMVSHPMMRISEVPVRENLNLVLGRYPMVWQGMLALKNDQSYVQMHFVSGSKDLPDQALPQVVFSGQALPLRISQRMRLEPPNLEGVTKRMINEKDYTLLLAVPCGLSHMDITDQTKNLTVGFIEYLRSKLAAGIVNVSQPGTNQPAFVVHVFPPCEFSMQVVNNHSQGLVEQIHDLAHVIIIITTV